VPRRHPSKAEYGRRNCTAQSVNAGGTGVPGVGAAGLAAAVRGADWGITARALPIAPALASSAVVGFSPQ
jgi:hypothetical protein